MDENLGLWGVFCMHIGTFNFEHVKDIRCTFRKVERGQ